ncbi:MAG: zinc-binding dehydrogenase, partial [Deltaproteobacteria bacterium]|nr:zinc-binding dehydrogenase [Deltaproteobacteria bacterium]
MRAVVFRNHGGPEVLESASMPEPRLRVTEVLVEVRACSVNHLDIWIRKGLPHFSLPLPHILGADVSGVVTAIGEEVEGVAVGERVFIAPGLSCGHCFACANGQDNLCDHYSILGEHRQGGYAEYVSVPRENIFSIPKGLTFAEAAAFPLTFLTAWQMVVRKARVSPNQTVLVLAAGSGVGNAALQIAKLFGARVMATASTLEKLAQAKSQGADELIQTGVDNLLEKVKIFTEGKGVDVVIEHVGEATWEESIRAVRKGGRVVTCGATSGYRAVTDLRHVFYRQIEILGSSMGSRADLYPIIEAVRKRELFPVIDSVLPLEEAGTAHRKMEQRKQFGKIVLE